MLSYTQQAEMADYLVLIYDRIEIELLKNLADAFLRSKYGGATEWRAQTLERMGWYNRKNTAVIAEYSGKTQTAVKEIFRDLGVNALNHEETFCQTAYDRGFLPTRPVNPAESAAISQILDAALGNAESYLNLVNTTCEQAAKSAYTDVVNKVYIETITGIKDYNTAIRHAVKSLAKNGLAAVTYCRKDGKKINYPVDAAVRRNIITSVGQTVGKMQLARAEEWGCNYMEVTSHFGARPSHAEWHGQVYMINGSSREYRNLAEATGYGTGEGLKGWNCRHDMYPFIPGFSVRGSFPVDLKKNEEEYKLTQKQRTLEREVRQLRRECVVSDKFGSKTEFAQKSLELKGKERELREFIETTERTQAARISTAGYNHSVSGKAAWAVKKTEKSVKMVDNKISGSKIYSEIYKAHIAITSANISKVDFVRPTCLTRAAAKNMQKAHRNLLRAMRNTANTECVEYYDINMNFLGKRIGSEGKGSVGGITVNQPCIVIHNHPDGLTFTLEKDVIQFVSDSDIQILTAVGHNGQVYMLEKTKSYDEARFSGYIWDCINNNPDYSRNIDTYINFVTKLLKGAKKYGVKYVGS